MNKGLVVKKTSFFQLLYVYGHTGGVLSRGFPFVKEGGVAFPAGCVSVWLHLAGERGRQTDPLSQILGPR